MHAYKKANKQIKKKEKKNGLSDYNRIRDHNYLLRKGTLNEVDFRHGACFKQGGPCHSGNYKV